MPLVGQQLFWPAPSCELPLTPSVNVASPELCNIWGDKRLSVTWSCPPAKLGSPQEYETSWQASSKGNSNNAGPLQGQILLLENGQQDLEETTSCPDFRYKESKEVILLNSVYKPAWVDSQVATWDSLIEGRSPASTSNSIDPSSCSGGYEGDITVESCKILCKKGKVIEAVNVLGLLVQTGLRIPNFLFHDVLKRCLAPRKNLVLGRRVHALAVQGGYHSQKFVANHILRMYASHGRLEEATQVFSQVSVPDTFMWFSMISAHAEHGHPAHAVNLYHNMRQSSVKPNSYVFVAALNACAASADLESGKQVHAEVLESGVELDIYLANSMVDMYAKCGRMEDARNVFDNVPTRNIVTWTAMIAGYANHGLGQDALALYSQMETEGIIVADSVAFSCLLKACGSIGAIQQGKQLHLQMVERGVKPDLVVGNCLVDMYAKCGGLEDARRVFTKLPKKDVVTWNIMLSGFAHCNVGDQAIECFHEMVRSGVQPNDITFICLLVACSHEGLVNEGRQYFNAMLEEHKVVPTREHYVCMVDLLGRSGHLHEAENMWACMPFEGDIAGWMSLLNACRIYGDIERGLRCFKNLVRLDPHYGSAYMVMAKIYADAGWWIDVDRVESLRKSAGASKKPAKAGIEVNKQVHTFVVGEERGDISSKLKNMNVRLKREGGHVPQTESVLKPVSDKKKEDELCGHAEKLALAYGLLNTPDGTSLLVTKNLRMCGDCHSATQIMSRIEKRKITVRDAHRVHRFVDGSCSCGNRP